MKKVIRVKLCLGPSGGYLAQVKLNCGVVQKPSWSGLRKYWPYATPRQIEYATASLAGPFAVFGFTVASGQEGIIAVWNVAKRRWEHISEASYVISAVLIEEINAIVSLHYVSYWGVVGHHRVEVRNLNHTINGFAKVSSEVKLPDKRTATQISSLDMHVSAYGNSDGKTPEHSGLFLLRDRATLIAQDAGIRYQWSLHDLEKTLKKLSVNKGLGADYKLWH